jgi:hypothetical protein
MLLDKTQRGWAMGSLGILAAAVAIYAPYALASRGEPRGGSAIGLLFGVVGFGFCCMRRRWGRETRADVAAGTCEIVDAGTFVVGAAGATDDLVPRGISFWGDADASTDVAADYHGGERSVRDAAAKSIPRKMDGGRAAGNDL